MGIDHPSDAVPIDSLYDYDAHTEVTPWLLPSELLEEVAPRVPGIMPAGTISGRYRIEGLIRSSGAARVYRARREGGGRLVALKVLSSSLRDPATRDAITREARSLARIQHPNVVEIFDAEDTPHGFQFAMEFAPGTTLRRVLLERERLPLKEALHVIREIGLGVAAAHERGVLHLDLKPENVMVDGQRVKVLDFGQAALVKELEAGAGREIAGAGTPEYMAPERFAERCSIDARTDIYSLASILHETVTGRHVFLRSGERLEAARIASMHLWFSPRKPPEMPPQLWEVVSRALSKDPQHRPESVEEFLSQVGDAMSRSASERHGATRLLSRLTADLERSIVISGAIAGISMGAWVALESMLPPGTISSGPLGRVVMPRPFIPFTAPMESLSAEAPSAAPEPRALAAPQRRTAPKPRPADLIVDPWSSK